MHLCFGGKHKIQLSLFLKIDYMIAVNWSYDVTAGKRYNLFTHRLLQKVKVKSSVDDSCFIVDSYDEIPKIVVRKAKAFICYFILPWTLYILPYIYI